MNPVVKIGRYELGILSVMAFKARDDGSGYDVLLTNGATIDFTPEEKQIYDDALKTHEQVMQVYGMCKGLGLRG